MRLLREIQHRLYRPAKNTNLLKKKPISTNKQIVEHKFKHTIEKIDSINLGGPMSIWHVTLESGYEEVIFAESYPAALKKAEYNEQNPDKKSNGFGMFYTLAKDIRDIRDDIEKIKKIIKIPED